jgi:tetratricopeptide (TPR) repeat protein
VSELLRRLDRLLQEESNPVARAELKARRAAYLGRIGSFDEARGLIAELRKVSQLPGYERIGVWAILCEGILEYFNSLNLNSFDRIMRAQRLSVALGDAVLIPVTSAWLTFAESERGRFEEMSEAAALALRSARTDDHESLARVSATLTYVFLTAGDRESSQFWFEKAHQHAVTAGDQATIEALMYNRASFGLACCRVNACYGKLDSAEISAVKLWIQTAKSFHALIGLKSLGALNDLSLARLHMVEGNFADALEALNDLEGRGPFAEKAFGGDVLNLERSFCLAWLGQLDEAKSAYSKIADIEMGALDEDDRLIVASMQVYLAKTLPSLGDEQSAITRFEARLSEYDSFRNRLRTLLRPFLQPI